MGITGKLLKTVKERVLGKYGEKLVSSIADTSSDAPSRYSEPKRDVYDKLVEEGRIGKGTNSSH